MKYELTCNNFSETDFGINKKTKNVYKSKKDVIEYIGNIRKCPYYRVLSYSSIFFLNGEISFKMSIEYPTHITHIEGKAVPIKENKSWHEQAQEKIRNELKLNGVKISGKMYLTNYEKEIDDIKESAQGKAVPIKEDKFIGGCFIDGKTYFLHTENELIVSQPIEDEKSFSIKKIAAQNILDKRKNDDKWILVENKLPDLFEYVLVCITGGEIFKARHYTNGWSVFFSDGEKTIKKQPQRAIKVEAWQPLPKTLKKYQTNNGND